MWRLAIDVGGTFTDAVAFNEASGECLMSKVFSLKERSASPQDQILRDLDVQGKFDSCVIGGTQVINMILERKGAKTAFITTYGFGDILEIRRGNRPSLYNLKFRKQASLVPRHLCFEVRERISAEGKVIAPLAIADLDRIVEALRLSGVESVAILFLHSYANPSHEVLCASYIKERVPDIAVSISSNMIREWREYERASTTVLNAFVQPSMNKQLTEMSQSMTAHNPGCATMAVQSSGGIANVAWVKDFPINLIESGPAAGANYCKMIAEMIGIDDLIYLDVGGTTAKCTLLRKRETALARDYRVGASSTTDGYPVRIPIIDIVEIGTGGGSIAHLNALGALQVGPQSAGAEPGPACYGRGGSEPTLTDAYLMTGIIDPKRFAGGTLTLRADKAQHALAGLATDLGLTVKDTASGIIRIANLAMTNALRVVSVRRGHDPRNFVLFACGGGGPMHAAALAKEVGINHIIVPPNPGYASAWGMMATEPRQDFVRTFLQKLSAASLESVTRIFACLEQEARAFFAKQDLVEDYELAFQHFLEVRYTGQQNEVSVPFTAGVDTLHTLARKFEEAHEQRFAFRTDHRDFEVVNYRLTATAPLAKPGLRKLGAPQKGLDDLTRQERLADLGAYGTQMCRIFERNELPVDFEVGGPAIIQESSATTVVLPGQRLRVDRFGILHIVDFN